MKQALFGEKRFFQTLRNIEVKFQTVTLKEVGIQ